MRELLERIRKEIMLPADIEEEIDAELAKPDPEPNADYRRVLKEINEFIKADMLPEEIKAELEKTEPEPVGIFSGKFKLELDNLIIDVKCYGPLPGVGSLLYTHPPAHQKPLSDDEISNIWKSGQSLCPDIIKKFARAIEQAHGIK